MRRRGTIDDVWFKLQRWSIKHLAYEYTIGKDGVQWTVYVDTMKDLRQAIASFLLDFHRQQASMPD